MVVRQHGRVSETSQPDLAALLRDILQQQTAMLQVQAESVRLQRVLVERLLCVSRPPSEAVEGVSMAPASVPAMPTETRDQPRIGSTVERAAGATPAESESGLPFAPAALDRDPTRGARYYQPRPSPV